MYIFFYLVYIYIYIYISKDRINFYFISYLLLVISKRTENCIIPVIFVAFVKLCIYCSRVAHLEDMNVTWITRRNDILSIT